MVSNRRGGYNAFHKALVKIGQEHLAEIMEPELDVVVDVMIKTVRTYVYIACLGEK